MIIAFYYFITSVMLVRYFRQMKYLDNDGNSGDCSVKSLTPTPIYYTFAYLVLSERMCDIYVLVYGGFVLLLIFSIIMIRILWISYNNLVNSVTFLHFFVLYLFTEIGFLLVLLTTFFFLRYIILTYKMAKAKQIHQRDNNNDLSEEEMLEQEILSGNFDIESVLTKEKLRKQKEQQDQSSKEEEEKRVQGENKKSKTVDISNYHLAKIENKKVIEKERKNQYI